VLGEEDVERAEALCELREGGASLWLEGDALVHEGLQNRRAVASYLAHVRLSPVANRVHDGRCVFELKKWNL